MHVYCCFCFFFNKSSLLTLFVLFRRISFAPWEIDCCNWHICHRPLTICYPQFINDSPSHLIEILITNIYIGQEYNKFWLTLYSVTYIILEKERRVITLRCARCLSFRIRESIHDILFKSSSKSLAHPMAFHSNKVWLCTYGSSVWFTINIYCVTESKG